MADLLPMDFVEETLANLPPASEAHADSEVAAASARRTKAVTMRLAGMTYDQIAAECGYTDRSSARHSILRALDRLETSRAEELRDLENARLDRAQAALWPKVLNGDVKAVEVWLRLSARRCRMNGMDAPMQVAVSPAALAGVDAAMERLHEVVMGTVIVSEVEGGGD